MRVKLLFSRLMAFCFLMIPPSISEELLLEEKTDISDIRKYAGSIKYSPFMVEEHDPEQLIQNWGDLNKFYERAINLGHRQCIQDLSFKKEQLERFLSNSEDYIEGHEMSEKHAFDFQYVLFTQVCLTSASLPGEIAKKYFVSEAIQNTYSKRNAS